MAQINNQLKFDNVYAEKAAVIDAEEEERHDEEEGSHVEVPGGGKKKRLSVRCGRPQLCPRARGLEEEGEGEDEDGDITVQGGESAEDDEAREGRQT